VGGRTAEVRRQEGRFIFVEPPPVLSLKARDPVMALAILRTGPEGDARRLDTPAPTSLSDRINSISWYHTIDLPGGVRTPGAFDHRDLVPHYGLPDSLAGQRVLDVNTFDGFWAFEFERRGAEVVAADIPRFSAIDFPDQARAVLDAENLDADVGAGFKIAHEALESKVQYRPCSVYDLDPETFGTFDLVHVGDLLLHLENPMRALRAIRSVTRGRAMIVDCFDPSLGSGDTVRYLGGWENVVWTLPSLNSLAQMIADAGFANVEVKHVFFYGGVTEDAVLWRASLIATP
jgi:tRNA (mo5U34)-methyltransferase